MPARALRPSRPWLLAATVATALSATGCGDEASVEPARVQYIEVAASDYKLELEPAFEAEITSYTALADGPDITVYVDVIVDRDVEGITVNDVPAEPNGFRAWRSAPATDLVSPTVAVVEVVDSSDTPARYEIEITVP